MGWWLVVSVLCLWTVEMGCCRCNYNWGSHDTKWKSHWDGVPSLQDPIKIGSMTVNAATTTRGWYKILHAISINAAGILATIRRRGLQRTTPYYCILAHESQSPIPTFLPHLSPSPPSPPFPPFPHPHPHPLSSLHSSLHNIPNPSPSFLKRLPTFNKPRSQSVPRNGHRIAAASVFRALEMICSCCFAGFF